MGKKKHSGNILYKIFIYVALLALAISIIIPVLWVFMASVKRNAEFIGADVNPWALPKQFFYQNFIVAFRDANGRFLPQLDYCHCIGTDSPSCNCSSGVLCIVKI